MRYLILLFIVFCCCEPRMENTKIEDYGVQQIGENLYLKKLVMNRDRVYLLVDSTGALVSRISNVDVTVSSGKTSHVETNTFFVK